MFEYDIQKFSERRRRQTPKILCHKAKAKDKPPLKINDIPLSASETGNMLEKRSIRFFFITNARRIIGIIPLAIWKCATYSEFFSVECIGNVIFVAFMLKEILTPGEGAHNIITFHLNSVFMEKLTWSELSNTSPLIHSIMRSEISWTHRQYMLDQGRDNQERRHYQRISPDK